MIFTLLSNPVFILPFLAALIIAFTVHEFSHALAAEWLGDPTPKMLGRLTLNPVAHIHGLGFLLLLVAGFGWGKPVPFDPSRLKSPRWGSAIVGLAGPFSNFILTLVGLAALSFLSSQGMAGNNLLSIFLIFLVQFNIILLIFNLIPVPPLDGSKLLFALIPDRHDNWREKLSQYGPFILLILILLDMSLPVSLLGRLFNFFLQAAQGFVR
ncbi:MAG: site-2 protease family protein [Parcubacteria group bacterium]|nr:site-2 protease family protein [Parcubacteria group bacterium]